MNGHEMAALLNVFSAALNGLLFLLGRNVINLICVFISLGFALAFYMGAF